MSGELTIILALLGGLGTFGGIIFGIMSTTSSKSKRDRDDATRTAVIETKLDLMLNGIEDVKKELGKHDTALQSHKKEVSKEISDINIKIMKINHELKQVSRMIGFTQMEHSEEE